MKKIFISVYCFIILSTFSVTAGEIKWRVSGESGFYRFSVSDAGQHTHFLNRLNAYLKLVSRNRSDNWWISFQVKPEWYQNSSKVISARLFSSGSYQKGSGRSSLGLGYDARKYEYSTPGNSISLEGLQLKGNFDRILSPKFFFSANPHYFYQDITHINRRQIDAFGIDLQFIIPFRYIARASAGIILEDFTIHHQMSEFPYIIDYKYSGFRWGPSVSFRFQQNFLAAARYNLLFHESSLTLPSSSEHYLQLSGGVLLPGRWTVLLFLEYYWNHVRFTTDKFTDSLIIPFDTENRIEIKLEKPLYRGWNFFTRMGYFRDVLLLESIMSRGWQFTVGLEFSN